MSTPCPVPLLVLGFPASSSQAAAFSAGGGGSGSSKRQPDRLAHEITKPRPVRRGFVLYLHHLQSGERGSDVALAPSAPHRRVSLAGNPAIWLAVYTISHSSMMNG